MSVIRVLSFVAQMVKTGQGNGSATGRDRQDEAGFRQMTHLAKCFGDVWNDLVNVELEDLVIDVDRMLP